MIAATEAMRAIDAPLVSPTADRLIHIARAHHAVGWKVNGAGGDGGTITVLGSPDANERARMCAALDVACDGHVIAHTIAVAGVQVRREPDRSELD